MCVARPLRRSPRQHSRTPALRNGSPFQGDSMKRFLHAVQVLVLGFVGTAFADPFQNGSFEVGTLTANPCNIALPVGSTAITGWTVINGAIDYVTPSCWNASSGTRSLD